LNTAFSVKTPSCALIESSPTSCPLLHISLAGLSLLLLPRLELHHRTRVSAPHNPFSLIQSHSFSPNHSVHTMSCTPHFLGIPLELRHVVYENLDRPRSLYNTALTSTQLAIEARNILHKIIDIDLLEGDQVFPLVRTLTAPHLERTSLDLSRRRTHWQHRLNESMLVPGLHDYTTTRCTTWHSTRRSRSGNGSPNQQCPPTRHA
jgi:hypothetical protein